MIFRVCEHYDEKQPTDYDYLNKDCFICYEDKTPNGNNVINLINQNVYLNKCTCNGPIHKECLYIWYNINKSCPICRKKMIEKSNNVIILFSYFPYGASIYYMIKIIMLAVLRFIFGLLLIHALIEFNFIIMRARSLIDDNEKLPIMDID